MQGRTVRLQSSYQCGSGPARQFSLGSGEDSFAGRPCAKLVLKSDRTREKDVVLLMNMLVHIGLEPCQAVQHDLIGIASIRGRGEPVGEIAYLFQSVSC